MLHESLRVTSTRPLDPCPLPRKERASAVGRRARSLLSKSPSASGLPTDSRMFPLSLREGVGVRGNTTCPKAGPPFSPRLRVRCSPAARTVQGAVASPGWAGHGGKHCRDQGQARVAGLGAPNLCRQEGGAGALAGRVLRRSCGRSSRPAAAMSITTSPARRTAAGCRLIRSRPTQFKCPLCGKTFPPETDAGIYAPADRYHGTMYDGWVCLFYETAGGMAADMGVVGRVEPAEAEKYFRRGIEILLLYADTIERLPTKFDTRPPVLGAADLPSRGRQQGAQRPGPCLRAAARRHDRRPARGASSGWSCSGCSTTSCSSASTPTTTTTSTSGTAPSCRPPSRWNGMT